jgi:hypothetical protein
VLATAALLVAAIRWRYRREIAALPRQPGAG